MNVLLTHPGTQHSFRLARELNRSNRLSKFVTSLAIKENSIWLKIAGTRLERRVIKELERGKVKSYPSLFVLEVAMRILGIKEEEIYYRRNLLFQERVIKNDLNNARIVIGFDTSSWKLARYCAANQKKFILDVSIGHSSSKEKIFSSLRREFPDWTDVALHKKDELIGLERDEFHLATRIVVPSNFVKMTLIENGVEESKIRVNPFGTDINAYPKRATKIRHETINFLFFGSLTARKGVPLLLKAWQMSEKKNALLMLAGYGEIPKSVPIPANVEVIGSVLPSERISLFQRADVFVFPSYFEGFAQVLIEAASFGLPIIGTNNSGASELIMNDVGGFIIEEGNSHQLNERIEYFICNPESIGIMSNDIYRISKQFTWENYSRRWEEIIDQVNNEL